MTVHVFSNGIIRLAVSKFKWAHTYSNGKLKYWSQLDNILSRYFTCVTSLTGVTTSQMISKSIQQIETSTDYQQHTLKFLLEQITSILASQTQKTDSLHMFIWVFAWNHRSPACYLQILKLLGLPSVRLVRYLSASIDVEEGNVSIKYLTKNAQCVEPHERVLNIQLDEIHIY